MQQKIKSFEVKRKGSKQIVTAKYSGKEYNKPTDEFVAVEITKKSSQYISKKLSNAIDLLIPHLMLLTDLVEEGITFKEATEYEKWFNNHEFKDNKQFENVFIDKVLFYGEEQVDSIKIFGHKLATRYSKSFKVKIETPQVAFEDTKGDEEYPLLAILAGHIDDIETLIGKYLFEGETLSKAEQMTLFPEESRSLAEAEENA